MLSDHHLEQEFELIGRLKQGERSAFDVLVQMYKDRGFAIAYNLVGSPEDAKDVLQEAFIKAYLNIKGFNEESKFYTWFYRILVNCALDFLRKKQRLCKIFVQPLVDEEGKTQETADERYETSKLILNQELANKLDKCVLELPEKQRLCFVLKHQNRLSNQEIAQILRCSVSTVKVHLFRAVRSLQDKLSAYLVK